jgi:hypothetical protein
MFTFVPAKSLNIEQANEAAAVKRASCCQSVNISIIPALEAERLERDGSVCTGPRACSPTVLTTVLRLIG